jgi:DNA (cytosine-5)-methyltransferase 1
MKVAGLFAGIGGFELGLAGTGHSTVMLCEIWNPARAVLAARFPCKRDVAELRSLPPEIELLVAGFPCQDLSQAGLTAGIGGCHSRKFNPAGFAW